MASGHFKVLPGVVSFGLIWGWEGVRGRGRERSLKKSGLPTVPPIKESGFLLCTSVSLSLK